MPASADAANTAANPSAAAKSMRLVSATSGMAAPIFPIPMGLSPPSVAGSDDAAEVVGALRMLDGRRLHRHSDDAREWLEAGIKWAGRLTKGRPFPTVLHRKKFGEVLEGAKVSVAVGFHEPLRSVVAFADARKPGRFVAGAAREAAGGGIEDFTLIIWPLAY